MFGVLSGNIWYWVVAYKIQYSNQQLKVNPILISPGIYLFQGRLRRGGGGGVRGGAYSINRIS